MAYAAYSEFLGASLTRQGADRHLQEFVVMSVTVPSSNARWVRSVIARCPHTGILRCIPQPHERLVQLQIHLPARVVNEVIHHVMECVPCGQIGRIVSWSEHLARYGGAREY